MRENSITPEAAQLATVGDVIELVGADVIQQRCDVSPYSIRAAIRDGRFPASWYRVLHELCHERGQQCPMCLFNFKTGGGDLERVTAA